MARIKSTNFYQKSGKVANEVFSNLGNGEVGCRAKNSKQAPLNEEQKINASGFSALNAEVRYLNPVLHVTFPRDTNGTKWANRFTSVNKKREGVLTTTKIHPDTPVDPKKKANEEYTSKIDWTKVLFAAGPLLVPSVTVNKANLNLEQIIAEKTRLRSRVTPLADAETPVVTAEEGEMYSITFAQEATVYEGAYCWTNDRVYGVIYSPEDHFALVQQLRDRGENGVTTIVVPSFVKPENIHVYSLAMTADGKITSNSVHTTLGA